MLHVSMPPLVPVAAPLRLAPPRWSPPPVTSEVTSSPSLPSALHKPSRVIVSSSYPSCLSVTSPPAHSQLPLPQNQAVPAVISVIFHSFLSALMPAVPVCTAAPLAHPMTPMGSVSGGSSEQLPIPPLPVSSHHQSSPHSHPDATARTIHHHGYSHFGCSVTSAHPPAGYHQHTRRAAHTHAQPTSNLHRAQSEPRTLCRMWQRPAGKGVDDIQALDKKLRSLFMDLGAGPPSAQSDVTSDPMAAASVPGTSSPTSCGTPLPPSSLPLNSSVSPQALPWHPWVMPPHGRLQSNDSIQSTIIKITGEWPISQKFKRLI